MPKFTLDTDLFMDAFSRPAADEALDAFLRRSAPSTHLNAIVMQELLAGAATDAQAAALQDLVFDVFERRRRVFGPSPEAFKECGRVLAALWRRDGVPFRRRPRSLVNDILVAVSCRERGVILVTADRDYTTLVPLIRGFRHVAPWP